MRRLLVLGLLLALPARAYAPTLERTVLVLLRALAYDRALPARVDEALRIGIVEAPGDAASHEEAAEVLAVLTGLEGTTVAGRPLGVPVTVLAGADLSAVSGALVVCRGLAPDALAAVVAGAGERDLPMLGLDSAYVGHGAALGVDQRGARLELVLDRAAAKDQGADFSSELLELARLADAAP